MRLIIELQALKSIKQKDLARKYPIALNGFLYKVLSSSNKFKGLHDKKDIKGFSFSTIHPMQDIREGNHYRIIVSATAQIIETLFFGIKTEKLNLGEGHFIVNNVSVEKRELTNIDTIETPFFLNLTKQVDGKIKPILYGDENYLDQLQKNLLHKYNQIHGIKQDISLFENVNVKNIGHRQTYAMPLEFDKGKFTVIGNKLSFKFNNITDEQLKVFQTCLDTGFGERCSYGFGFMVKK